jgi:predicted NUDIX family phosphoesterase
MSAVESEKVLVVPTQLLHQLGYFQGFSTDVDRYFAELLNPNVTAFRPRGEMEEDASFKQLIPYIIFRHTDANGVVRLFHYKRGAGQGEKRLHAKRSIGIGGHISSIDANESNVYAEGMRRELDEEVDIQTAYQDRCVGLLNDDQTEVGKVHLGVVHIFDVDDACVSPREREIHEAEFRTLDELHAVIDEFESWSAICLEALFPQDG